MKKRNPAGGEHVRIKNDAIRLMGKLAELEPRLPRTYKFTPGRLLMDWSALLVFRIDRMLMLHDKGAALEEVAATVRTIEITLLNLVSLNGFPAVSPVTESEVAQLCVNIEEQARNLWRVNRDRLKAEREKTRQPHDSSGVALPPRQGAPPVR